MIISRRRLIIGASALVGSSALMPAHAQFNLSNVPGLGGGNSMGFAPALARGTSALVRSLSEIQNALANRERAAELQAFASDINTGGMDEDQYREANAIVDETPVDEEAIAEAAAENAQSHITRAYIFGGTGVYYDTIASNAGQREARSGLSGGARGLMRGGGDRSLNIARLAVETLPAHISSGRKIIGGSRQYFQLNNVQAPSRDEANAIASQELGVDVEIDDSAFGE